MKTLFKGREIVISAKWVKTKEKLTNDELTELVGLQLDEVEVIFDDGKIDSEWECIFQGTYDEAYREYCKKRLKPGQRVRLVNSDGSWIKSNGESLCRANTSHWSKR